MDGDAKNIATLAQSANYIVDDIEDYKAGVKSAEDKDQIVPKSAMSVKDKAGVLG